MTLQSILNRHLRANPDFRLVPYERLDRAEQETLRPLAADAEFYGVLRGAGRVKAVDPETALLFMTLRQPGPVPHYVQQRLGSECNRALADLILEEVLQLENGAGFVSGAAAHAVLFVGDDPDGEEPTAGDRHPLTALAHAALRYAQALPTMDAARLAQRLYQYNTQPITPAWRRRLPDGPAVLRWLGVKRAGAGWRRADETPGWLAWQRLADEGRRTHVPYKLYVSPRPAALPETVGAALPILEECAVPSFKIGAGAPGVLRPDKMVVYLTDFEQLATVGRALQAALAELPAQGVPFTAPIDARGLLSWGMDPPPGALPFAGDVPESWRFWVATRLATALLDARANAGSGGPEPWRFALDRLQTLGLDTKRWVPRQSIWQM